MKKLKIAIVANSCWNIYNFRKELIQHLKQAGHQIIVIAPVDEFIQYLNDAYFTKHIPLHHLESQGSSWFKDILLLKELFKIYKNEKPDLVFQFTIKPNIYGSIAARLLDIKCISNLTGLGYAFRHGKFSFVLSKLYKWALEKNEKVVFHNAEDLHYFVKNKMLLSENGIVIPGSGIDPDKFRPVDTTKDNEKCVFIFIGRLLKDKGLVEFVKAAIEARSIARNAVFWIIGEMNATSPNAISKTDLLEWVESRVIKYLGNVRDVRKYIGLSDVVVLPSYREGLPRAILEAMSMEKPIILSNVAGCKELVIEGWNGLLVPPKDVHSLSEAMVQMFYKSHEQRMEMGKRSRQLVLEKYDLKIVLNAYDELIKEIYQKQIISEKSVFKDHS